MNIRILIAMTGALLVSACSDNVTPKQEGKKTEEPKQVAFDPAFSQIAGTWKSEPGALGEGRFLRVDIASGGGFSIDVRTRKGENDQIVESATGKASLSSSMIRSTPSGEIKGNILKSLGRWTASVDASAKKMTLQGDDGKKIALSWMGL